MVTGAAARRAPRLPAARDAAAVPVSNPYFASAMGRHADLLARIDPTRRLEAEPRSDYFDAQRRALAAAGLGAVMLLLAAHARCRAGAGAAHRGAGLPPSGWTPARGQPGDAVLLRSRAARGLRAR
jgi:hypothetical protein